MEKKLKLGIIGLGALTQTTHIPIFKRINTVEIVAICDIDVRKLDHIATQLGVKKRYVDFQALIEDEEVEAVVIATPTYLHAPMTIAALNFGKHVFCEKPMSTTLEEAEEMVAAAYKAKRKLAIGLNNRFRPDVQTLKNFIDHGELGDIFYMKAGWLMGRTEWDFDEWHRTTIRAGGGSFSSIGVNLLDICLWFLEKKEPIAISGACHTRIENGKIDDAAVALIRYHDDTFLTIEVGWSLMFEKDFLYCNMFGQKGAALLNPLGIHKEMHGHLVNVTPTIPTKNYYRISFELEDRFFVESILRDQTPVFSGQDGLLIARVVDAFYRSVRQKTEVRFDSIKK
ncbi:MAG: Gfo/Idh/MocA family oxidoreductase [candidate division WOR-3 bacterium]